MDWHGFEMIYITPGRLRLRGTHLWSDPGFGQRIRNALVKLPGVEAVRTNLITGSLTVDYLPEGVNAVTKCIEAELADVPFRVLGADLMLADERIEPTPGGGRPTREQAQARAAAKRRTAVGLGVAAFVAGLVARKLIFRR